MKASKRTLLYVVWIAGWVFGCKFLESIGLVAHASWFFRVFEALLSCFAALVMQKSKVIKWIIFIYLLANLIMGFGIAGIFCYVMSMAVYFLAKSGNTKAQTEKRTVTYVRYPR